MNIKRGLNRIFFILGLIASVLGFITGKQYAISNWKPNVEEAFHSISWDSENIKRYYEIAKKNVKTSENKRDKPHVFDLGEFLYAERAINPEDLSKYHESPPFYNKYVFKDAFPETLITPRYKIYAGGALGSILFFCSVYAGLSVIFITMNWIVNGFKEIESSKGDETSGSKSQIDLFKTIDRIESPILKEEFKVTSILDYRFKRFKIIVLFTAVRLTF